jgi:ubiquinone/menaquinone biosynthesis C-methylase UbiE
MRRKSEKEHWDRFWVSSGGVQEIYSNDDRVAEQIERALSVDGLRVLEVGAGSGRDGIHLAGSGAKVVSLDYSLPSLRMIRSQLEGRTFVKLCCGDAFDLPFADGTFDIVFHQGLLEHFRNPDDLITENRRVLRAGGLLLVDVPQKYHYYTLVKHVLIAMGRWFAGWETEFSIGGLERILRDHSFSIVSSYGEWLNPPIWYRMLRRAAFAVGIRMPMYPWIFTFVRRRLGRLRSGLLRKRWVLYTTLVVGTLARKE